SRNLAYNKWSLALKTLENQLGRQNFDEILRTYFQRWRFRHPSRNDFIAVANEVVNENLDWFFDQVIFGNGVVDYAFGEIIDSNKVVVRRIGEVQIPVEVLVGFSDGSQTIEEWDSQSRTHTFSYPDKALVTKVIIDPELKIPLDVNLMNNSYTPVNTHFMQKYLSKWFFWMQSILVLLATIS
ncbi:MAG: M1 family peptidase, partial [bacterium]